jgi:hypothetical protein
MLHRIAGLAAFRTLEPGAGEADRTQKREEGFFFHAAAFHPGAAGAENRGVPPAPAYAGQERFQHLDPRRENGRPEGRFHGLQIEMLLPPDPFGQPRYFPVGFDGEFSLFFYPPRCQRRSIVPRS